MNLFNIAFRNIKRNFYNYFLYFTSMVFSIMIYYVFTSIQYNKQVIDLAKESAKISTGFKAASIIIAVFAAMFILYSSSFFTRRRKKEVALYCMLGVKKKQVARMLFYENLVMGAVALIAGILIGSLFSKLFIMILVKLMGFEVKIKFAISLMAILNTTVVFLVLFIITSLHGYSIIYRFQLIELFKSEKTGQKKPKASVLIAILSVIFIGTGYYMAFVYNFDSFVKLLVILVVTVIGTYLLFSSLVVFLVKLLRRNKIRYFRGVNMIGTSHLLYRIKSHGKSLATIAVLSATTITAMGTASSIYYTQVSGINKSTPFSYAYISKSPYLDQKVDEVINKYPKNKLKDAINVELLNVKAKYPNLIKMGMQRKGKYYYDKGYVISESTLRKLMQIRGIKDDFVFNNNEVFLLMDWYSDKVMDNPKGHSIYYNIENKETSFKIRDFKDYLPVNKIFIGKLPLDEIEVVKDDVYNKMVTKSNVIKLRLLNIENQKKAKEVTKEIQTTITKSKLYKEDISSLSSYYDSYTITMASMGMIIFLASFVGLVFLICTGSIIFFKQLSEANDDKDRYEILRKIGVKKSEIRTSIAKQMLFVFVLPLALGICHSFMALRILEPLLGSGMIYPVCITVGIYTVIYLLYYILTVNSYCKIVNQKA